MNKKEQQLSHIKKVGETDYISKEEFESRIQEIAKCKRSIVYFAEKYFRIISLDKGLHIIKLYQKQKDLLNFFVNENRCLTLASRQTGKTTSYTIYALWTLIFNPEKRIMLLANKADTVLEILGRIQMAYEYLPVWLKPAVVVWNKGEIQFSNKSMIKGFPTASDAARGFSAGIVIMDEAAFVPNNIASKVFESIYPVISSSKKSKFIIVSTPNGADPNNLYYSLWQQANQKTAEKNREGWKPFRIDWWDVPGRDQKWKEQTVASIGEKRFAQEFGNEFLTGKQGRKLMPDDVLEKYRMKLSELKTRGIKPVEQQILSEDEQRIYKFKMWREFDASRTYAAAADIAEGVGQDSSVLYLFDVTDLRDITMCAKFSSADVSLVEFAYVCSKVLQLYGSPPLFAERNGVSAGMLDSLRITYKYQNIARESKNGEAGIYSHVTVKGRACLWAREMMTTFGFGFTLPDQDLLDELGSFVKKDTSGRHTVFQAAAGSHDDHVMTLVWLCWGLSKEIIDKYFIVVKSFTSQLGEMLPQILMPLNPYSSLQIKEISQDPVYRRFMEIKNECLSAYNAAMQAEQNGKDDVFGWNNRSEPQYFQDEWIGPSWNGGSFSPLQTSVNPNNVMPAFFVG